MQLIITYLAALFDLIVPKSGLEDKYKAAISLCWIAAFVIIYLVMFAS